MKIKRVLIVVLLVLVIFEVIFVARPSYAIFSQEKTELESTTINCTVESKYDFSLPDDETIVYPQTSEYLGEFVIEDLLLDIGETLSVNLVLGQMTKTDNSEKVLSYGVAFDSPGSFTAAQIGAGYGIAVSVNEAEFASADVGAYRAALLFQVISSPSNMVVWEDTLYVRVIRPRRNSGVQSGNDNDDDNNDENDDEQGQGNVGDSNDDEEEQGSERSQDVESDGIDAIESKEVDVIEDEPIPAGKEMGAWLWWFLGGCGLLLILLLLFFLIMRRKKDKAEQ